MSSRKTSHHAWSANDAASAGSISLRYVGGIAGSGLTKFGPDRTAGEEEREEQQRRRDPVRLSHNRTHRCFEGPFPASGEGTLEQAAM